MGRRIVEHEQEGKENTNDGDYVLERLSKDLTHEFGKGDSKRNLEFLKNFN